jgi:cystine transport system permease protein
MTAQVTVTRRAALAALGGALTTTGCLGRGDDPLVVAATPPRPPFVVRSRCCTWETTELTGFDVDVAAAIGDRLDRPVEVVGRAATALRAPPDEWSFDVGMGGQVVPAEPPAARQYVGPYLRGYHCVLSPASTDVDARALAGGRVGVASARAERAAGRLVAWLDGDLRVERFADHAAASDALGDGLAGVVADQVTNAMAAAEDGLELLAGPALGDGGVETPHLSLGVDDYGLVVAAGDPLGGRLADALAALRAAGRLRALREPYFTAARLPRPGNPAQVDSTGSVASPLTRAHDGTPRRQSWVTDAPPYTG